MLPYLPPIPSLDDEPSLDEVRRLQDGLKNNKYVGLDGIPVELLRYGGSAVVECLHQIIMTV